MQTYEKRYTFERLPSPQRGATIWKQHLKRHWGHEESWATEPYLPVGQVRELLGRDMPELLPDFEALLPLYGDGPAEAQGLAMYNLRPFWTGCSETISRRPDRTTMLRNYDLGIDSFSGLFRHEELADGGWIIGAADAGWGYLDGMNDRGLVASLTFGGRYVTGDGYAVLLVIRWLLQTCATVEEAIARLERVPHRLAQNLLLLDRSGAHAVVYVSPDRGVTAVRGGLACTNHQMQVDVPGHARFTRTVERLDHLTSLDGGAALTDFLRPPLYNQQYKEYFGTLYSVEYDPVGQTAHYAWPGRDLVVGPDSPETSFVVTLTEQG